MIPVASIEEPGVCDKSTITIQIVPVIANHDPTGPHKSIISEIVPVGSTITGDVNPLVFRISNILLHCRLDIILVPPTTIGILFPCSIRDWSYRGRRSIRSSGCSLYAGGTATVRSASGASAGTAGSATGRSLVFLNIKGHCYAAVTQSKLIFLRRKRIAGWPYL